MTADLVILVAEIMKSLAMLLEALAMAGFSSFRQPLDGEALDHVREGLHEVKHMVNMVMEHLNSGGSGASGSQGPLPRPPTPAVVIPATPAAHVTPAMVIPGTPAIVFVTTTNMTSKGGKYHTSDVCDGLRNAISKVMAKDLEALLAVPRHSFELCLVCKNRAT